MAIDSHGYLLGGSSNLTGSSHLIIYTVNGLYQSYMVITHLLTIFDNHINKYIHFLHIDDV